MTASRSEIEEAPLIAGVELGGTKTVVVLARGMTILERSRLPTVAPDTTLGAICERLASWRDVGQEFQAIGIGSFGPLGLDASRPDFGHVTTTPKAAWAGTDLHGPIATRFDVPVGLDTDVNGAARAEWLWGAAQGCDVAVYLTIGTGVGGGVVVAGQPVHGLLHPEHGHLRVRRRLDDDFPGICPYHGDCIEGLTSGPAIAARAGVQPEMLSQHHRVWQDVTDEIAELMAHLVLILSPQRIVLGGGVGTGQRWMLPRVRRTVLDHLGGYLNAVDEAAIERLIVSPALGDDSGPLGSVALGLAALGDS